ncbi:hypothetical protein H0O01_00525, partial [Candidatus Micrarchaeota archaeon]|nr:hypothetical protein [Candidatus Micrarchaeota archaeon]
MDYIILSPCVTAKTRELRMRGKIDIRKAEKSLPPNVDILALTEVFLTLAYKGKSFSLYPSGKIIVKDSESEEAKSLLKE